MPQDAPSKSIMETPNWALLACNNCYEKPLKTFSLVEPSRDYLSSWSFSSEGLSHDEIISNILFIFEELLLSLKISSDKFKILVEYIMENYPLNSYHNIRHALEVLQSLHYIFTKSESGPFLKSVLTPLHIFSLYVSALSHDIGHLGMSNNFLKNSRHPLGLIYNDHSPLENMHSFIFFSILNDALFADIFINWKSSDYSLMRRIVIKCVLATDMSYHQNYIDEFKRNVPESITNSSYDENAQIFLCVALMKAADICNVSRPFTYALNWANSLYEEFRKQVLLI